MNDTGMVMLDVDWAPDHVIEHVAGLLLERRVRATWFVTHATPALDRLRAHDELFELGIHPNFNPNSTHGQTMNEVIAHCLALVPEAVSARSHGLMQSDYLWRYYLEQTPIRYECSTYVGDISQAYLSRFHWNNQTLYRLPSVFQDNMEMVAPEPVGDAATLFAARKGLRALSFHPLFVYMNSTSPVSGEALKALGKPFYALTEDDLRPLIQSGPGAGALFVNVLDYLAERDGGLRVKDVVSGEDGVGN